MTPEETAAELCESMAVEWGRDFIRPHDPRGTRRGSEHEAWIKRIAAAIAAENEGIVKLVNGWGLGDGTTMQLLDAIRARVQK